MLDTSKTLPVGLPIQISHRIARKAPMRHAWLLLAAVARALPQLTNKSYAPFVGDHSVTLLRVCAERCASDAALDAIDIEGVGVAAATRDIAAVREFDAELLLVHSPQLKGQTSNRTTTIQGRRWDVYLGGRAYEDMVWWLRRLVEGRDPVQDERLGFRPGLFSAYDAWGEWSLRLGYRKTDPPVYELDGGALEAIANGADDRLWVVFFYSDRSKRDRAAKASVLRLAEQFREKHGTAVAVGAHNARVWPERARQHGRVVVSDSGPKLAFACLQNGKWLNGAMSLPRDLESAIYGWAARLAVGGLPDTELTTRLGPNGEEF